MCDEVRYTIAMRPATAPIDFALPAHDGTELRFDRTLRAGRRTGLVFYRGSW